MTEQFDRIASVIIGNKDISGLDVAFRVKKTLTPDPNKAEISVYNLGSETRSSVETAKTVHVKLKVGYRAAGLSQLFQGDLRRAFSAYKPPDWVTTIRTGDGETAHATARVNKSFKSGATIQQVLSEITTALGIGAGNATQKFNGAQLRNALSAFSKGIQLSGQATKELERLAKSAGFEYSIQDGQLQILNIGEALAGTAVLLSPESGLVGSPEPGAKGLIKARALLNPNIFPGRKIKLESRTLKGFYRVESAEYVGDTAGDDWYVDIEGKEVKSG